jgi:hypothetical protein
VREKGELERRLNSCKHGRRRGVEPMGSWQKKEKPRGEKKKKKT